MKGSIRKQSKSKGTWQIRIDLGNNANGKRKRKIETFRGDKQGAERRLRELLLQLDNGLPMETSKDTVNGFLAKWMETYVKTNCSARTLEGYQWYVKRYVIPKLGNVPLVKLAPQDVQGLYADMLERGLSARTVLHAHRILKEALSHAVKWGYIIRNVCDAVDPPRPRHKEMKALNAVEVQKLLEASNQSPYRHIFYLAIYSGLRLGELLGLRWSDLDIENRALSINRAIARIAGKGLVVTEPKTARSRRLISLPESTVALLSSMKAQQRDLWESRDVQLDEEAYIFSSWTGGPMSPDTVSHAFRKIIRKSGLPEVRFHDLRHTHATLMLKQGVHPKIVSERLGHSSINITLDTYSHVLPGMQEAAVDAFEKALNEVQINA